MEIDRTSRDSVRRAYQQWYKPALAVPLGWEGKLSTCRAGNPSTAAQRATLDMVNFFRELVDDEPVTFDPVLSGRAQLAALIMEANMDLSHEPPKSWKCWSELGALAAGRSNLALGASGAAAIDLYMRDPGDRNVSAGHRSGVLSPENTVMGSGSTPFANALWDSGPQDADAYVPKIVAWPPPGYFPSTLDPAGRWSFSIDTEPPGAIFTDLPDALAKATVSVRDNTGKALRAKIVSPGYSSVVWEVDGTTVEPGHMDRTFRVTIDGIDYPAFPKTYTYWVTAFDPETATAPKSDPLPPVWVSGWITSINATNRKVTINGVAHALSSQPTVVISRNGKTLQSMVATRPRTDGLSGWRYEQSVPPGTFTYCAHFPNSNFLQGFSVDCRQLVVK